MASGDTLLIFEPKNNDPPATIYATLDTRNLHPVLDFDAAADEEAVFPIFLPKAYGGGGITITLIWMASTATSGNVVWQAAFERHVDDGFDLDSDGFAAFNNGGQDVAPSASGEVSYDTVTFTDGVDMDSLAANESGRLKIRRDADSTDATDDMAGDAELLRVIVKET